MRKATGMHVHVLGASLRNPAENKRVCMNAQLPYTTTEGLAALQTWGLWLLNHHNALAPIFHPL